MTEWKPGQPIGYVRSEIPEFDMPAYQGQHYESMAPDTLDLWCMLTDSWATSRLSD